VGPVVSCDHPACTVLVGGLAAAGGVRGRAVVIAGGAYLMPPAGPAAMGAGAMVGARLVTLWGCGQWMWVEPPANPESTYL
jgi:hypothetical protein